ncbi:hypothetical protein QTI66_30025 [Variovorax sp. J22R133]|uniref:hypothetical protein n=1 Tax=Variovorax brevis TaxID=3053503 RepID=UPI0025786583|nr:hypothetical protein [Variovorax sp. J22R133]MDM0116391.1 hypothetical protein [Variovorax sp. J22R133]
MHFIQGILPMNTFSYKRFGLWSVVQAHLVWQGVANDDQAAFLSGLRVHTEAAHVGIAQSGSTCRPRRARRVARVARMGVALRDMTHSRGCWGA